MSPAPGPASVLLALGDELHDRLQGRFEGRTPLGAGLRECRVARCLHPGGLVSGLCVCNSGRFARLLTFVCRDLDCSILSPKPTPF